jgi:pyridoxine/pyridoxamine 5'-phosphate oxidase
LQISLQHPLIPSARCLKKLRIDRPHHRPEEVIITTTTEEEAMIVEEEDTVVVAEGETRVVMLEDKDFRGMVDTEAEDRKGEDIQDNREWGCLNLSMSA